MNAVPHRVIENEADILDFTRLLEGMTLPVTLEWVQGRDRSSEQNRLQWLWAKETAEQFGDRTFKEVQQTWKLHHGVPILRRDSPEFRETYDTIIKPLPYQAKVAVMKFIDVTSQFKVRQMVEYLDTVQRECLEQGIRLTDPDPALAKYQQTYRAREAA